MYFFLKSCLNKSIGTLCASGNAGFFFSFTFLFCMLLHKHCTGFVLKSPVINIYVTHRVSKKNRALRMSIALFKLSQLWFCIYPHFLLIHSAGLNYLYRRQHISSSEKPKHWPISEALIHSEANIWFRIWCATTWPRCCDANRWKESALTTFILLWRNTLHLCFSVTFKERQRGNTWEVGD